jgi:hypothetical protein
LLTSIDFCEVSVLKSINAFLDKGAGKSTREAAKEKEASLKRVRAELAKGRGRGEAVRKVNELINDVVNKIADGDALHSVADGTDGDRALYHLLHSVDPSKGQCGTDAILDGTEEYDPGDDTDAAGEMRRATWRFLPTLIAEARAAGPAVAR